MTVNLAIIGIGRIGKIHANSIFTQPLKEAAKKIILNLQKS